MAAKSRNPAIELPASFEARGVRIPFLHARLGQVRVRAEAGAATKEWEALVGDDPKPTRLPWQKLTGIMQFPPRDMALYFAVSARGEKGLDPLVVRDLTAEVDREHGVDAAARGRCDALAKNFAAECRQARAALQRAGFADADLDALPAGFAKLGVPTGPEFPADGELGAAAARLDAFFAEIRAYERGVAEEDAQRALLVAFAVSQFRGVLRAEYAKIAGLAADPSQCVAAGAASLDVLANATRRVAFALDGWAPCLDIWARAKTRGPGAPRDAMDFVLQTMPVLPGAEAGGAEAQACWAGIARQRASFVRVPVDWIDFGGGPE
jgi:hypothetical protein